MAFNAYYVPRNRTVNMRLEPMTGMYPYKIELFQCPF